MLLVEFGEHVINRTTFTAPERINASLYLADGLIGIENLRNTIRRFGTLYSLFQCNRHDTILKISRWILPQASYQRNPDFKIKDPPTECGRVFASLKFVSFEFVS